MYPIKFENIYYEKIWGGRDFEIFRDNIPNGDIGESWDIACHKNGMSIVANGSLKGKALQELINEYKTDLVGTNINTELFPLLVKLINSKGKLSVQVHPNDEYSKRVENELGKTEAWYVIYAKPGAKLIVGTKNCDKKIFEKAIKENKCEDYLNAIEVKKGDTFLIKSGLIHAIGEGIIIAEIQQSSDITYRVYDYGRPRELHIEKSLQVIDFNLQAENLSNKEDIKYEGYSKIELCENQYFGMEKINVITNWTDFSNTERFFILTCVDGNGTIVGNGYNEEIKKGDSYLIPAILGEYTVKGNIELIKSYPN